MNGFLSISEQNHVILQFIPLKWRIIRFCFRFFHSFLIMHCSKPLPTRIAYPFLFSAERRLILNTLVSLLVSHKCSDRISPLLSQVSIYTSASCPFFTFFHCPSTLNIFFNLFSADNTAHLNILFPLLFVLSGMK